MCVAGVAAGDRSALPGVADSLGAVQGRRPAAKKIGQRTKPASVISKQLLIRLMRWFPGRRFVLLRDSKALSHAVACFAERHADRVTVISRLRANANLYGEPKPRTNIREAASRPRAKKLPAPEEQIQTLKHQQATVAWYGSVQHKVNYRKPSGGVVLASTTTGRSPSAGSVYAETKSRTWRMLTSTVPIRRLPPPGSSNCTRCVGTLR